MAEQANGNARRRPRPAKDYGGAFAELLSELGYDEAPLQVESLDALFALPSVRVQAFLAWFLASIRARHSVKAQLGGGASDYALFQALQRGEHGGLLSEEALVLEEMAVGAQQSEPEETLDELQSANSDLEHEVQALERRLQLTHAKNDKLETHIHRARLQADEQTRGCRDRDALCFPEPFAADTTAASKCTTTAASTGASRTALGLEMDTLLDQLAQSDGRVQGADMLSPAGLDVVSSRDNGVYSSKFLYAQSISSMSEAETQTLHSSHAEISRILSGISPSASLSEAPTITSPTASSSDDVAVSVSSSERPGSSLWAHEADPTTLGLEEQDLQTYKRCCVELARLEKAYVVGERDALQAELGLARAETRWTQVTETQPLLRQQYELLGAEAVEAKRQELSRAVQATRRELAESVEQALPLVLQEAACLQSTTVLLDNYEHKLWRQETRFLRLRKLLDALDLQCARLGLVHRLLDAETQDLKQLDHALASGFQQLERESEKTVARVERHKRVSSTLNSVRLRSMNEVTRSSLGDSDQVGHTLLAVLEDVTGHSRSESTTMSSSFRIRTFDELEQLCSLKKEQEATLAVSEQELDREWLGAWSVKREALRALRRELFGDNSSATPLLVPAQLARALQETVEIKEQTETAVDAALESLRAKQRAVELDASSSVRAQQRANLARLQRDLQHQQDAGEDH